MRISRLCFIACSISVTLLGAECGSAIKVNEQRRKGQVHILAKNSSHTPLVAYVLAGENNSADGSPTKVYSGVFSGPSTLAPGKSIEVDVRQGDLARPHLFVDYVRLADGWTCGNAVTEDAKKVAARFER